MRERTLFGALAAPAHIVLFEMGTISCASVEAHVTRLPLAALPFNSHGCAVAGVM